MTREDDIRIDLNGKVIDPAQFQMSYSSWGKLEAMRYFDESWIAGPYWLFEVRDVTQFLKDGANEMGLTLIRANPMLDSPITLFEVRVRIRSS